MLNKLKTIFPINGRLLFALPYVIGAGIFIIFPVAMMISKATTDLGGVDNLQQIKDPQTWEVMFRSVYLGLASAFISLAIAFPFAYVVGRSKSKSFKAISIALIVSPLFIFGIAKVFALRILLIKMYDDPAAIQNQGVMIMGMVYLYMPFMIIPLYSVFQEMPGSLIEASKDLGFGRISTVFKVVFPYALKAVFSGLALVFMLSATSLVISTSLLGNDVKGIPHDQILIGNKMDILATNMRQNDVAAAWGSTLALATIAVMMAIYSAIYFIPVLIRKIRGGVNV